MGGFALPQSRLGPPSCPARGVAGPRSFPLGPKGLAPWGPALSPWGRAKPPPLLAFWAGAPPPPFPLFAPTGGGGKDPLLPRPRPFFALGPPGGFPPDPGICLVAHGGGGDRGGLVKPGFFGPLGFHTGGRFSNQDCLRGEKLGPPFKIYIWGQREPSPFFKRPSFLVGKFLNLILTAKIFKKTLNFFLIIIFWHTSLEPLAQVSFVCYKNQKKPCAFFYFILLFL